MKKYLAVLPALFILQACQTVSDSVGSISLFTSSKDDAEYLIGPLPAPDERQWSDDKKDIIEKRAAGNGLVNMPVMQNYLNKLYAKIKTTAGVPGWPGKVYITADKGLTASASAAGNIYISQAWIAEAETEDEIVGLLSHEFAHVYNDFDKINDFLPEVNRLTDIAYGSSSYIRQLTGKSGWSDIDNALAAYEFSRDISQSMWSRQQESDADMLGMNIYLKMGYSYDEGFRSMLERLIAYEDNNIKLEKEREEKVIESIKAEAIKAMEERRTSNGEFSVASTEALGKLSGGVDVALHKGSNLFKDIWGSVTSSHPDSKSRLARLEDAFEVFYESDELSDQVDLKDQAVTRPWQRAKNHSQTKQITSNYKLAFEALGDASNPSSLAKARRAASGVTSSHAVPVNAYGTVLAAHAKNPNPNTRLQNTSILNRNINSPANRSWVTYVERSKALQEAGKDAQAYSVLTQGFNYFKSSSVPWPKYIEATGYAKGWDEAKKMALECTQKFAAAHEQCLNAAKSPKDQAKNKQISKDKTNSLLSKFGI